MSARGHGESVNLRLDVHRLLGVCLEPCNIYFDVEVTNAIRADISVASCTGRHHHLLADNRVLGQYLEVLAGDDIAIASGGNDDVRTWRGVLHGGDLVPSHGRLEGIDRIDFCDDDTGAVRSQ